MKPQTMRSLVNQMQRLLPKNGRELIGSHLLIPSTQLPDWLPQGLLSSRFIEIVMNKLLGKKSFEQLSKPMAVTATDLQTGELVIFTAEELIPKKPWPQNIHFLPGVSIAEAVRASCAIPGIFTPKTMGEPWLMRNCQPAGRCLTLSGASKVVAVDLGLPSSKMSL